MYCGPQRLSRRKAFRAAARLTGRLPIAGTNECRFVRWMQSERETDEKERSFEGTRCPTMLAKVGISGTVGPQERARFAFGRVWRKLEYQIDMIPRDTA